MSAVTAESNLQLVAQASELMRLAFEIANDSAQSDVECMCHIHSGNADEGWWYELGKPSPELGRELEEFDYQYLARAVHFLELAHLLVRHPTVPNVVSFKRR